MPSKVRPPDVEEVLAAMQAVKARGRGRRSPLFLWFDDNYDALVVSFERSAPAWTGLAQLLGERGLRDADGKIPTARGTRDAWYRVGKERQAAAAEKVTKAPVQMVRPVVTPPVPQAAPAPKVEPVQTASPDVQDILGRLGGSRSRGNRLPNSVG